MNTAVKNCLSKVTFGGLQQHKNVAILPLLAEIPQKIEYLILKEAMEGRSLTVTEVSQGGSVPELKVVNKADIPVLLLDGEELIGAKQNRILNTTILLKENSETIIPVSCTEQGRWSYDSPDFADSGVLMSPVMRSSKLAAVHASLESGGRFKSDQGALWNDIDRLSVLHKISSSTGAIKDVFIGRKNELDDYLKAFPHVPGQKGLLVFIGPKTTGFDLVPREAAYKILHPKLVKSYIMDALIDKEKEENRISPDDGTAFLKQALSCSEKMYDSIGHGQDLRYQGDAIIGSALVHREEIIHTAFFAVSQSDKAGRMAGLGRRRGFRTFSVEDEGPIL